MIRMNKRAVLLFFVLFLVMQIAMMISLFTPYEEAGYVAFVIMIGLNGMLFYPYMLHPNMHD